jgi:DNA processing protein
MSAGAPGRRPGGPNLLRRPADLDRELVIAGARGRRRRNGGWDDGDGWPTGFADRPQDRRALLVLLGLASMTARRLMELASSYGSAASCLEAIRRGDGASAKDQDLARSLDPSAEEERLIATGATLVAVYGRGYPDSLLDLFDPPAGLFVRGATLEDLVPRVAIVGARNCSAAGREMAAGLGRALTAAGVCVVSGAARGIDAAAHRGAISMAGPTVAVLGGGIDVAYPRENRRLLHEIAGSGAVVSEYPPGTRAEPFRFPARNRIVAALSSAVVVVEGAAGSGSMITADHALDLGRDVFAVPGSVNSALAEVPLALIREGAVPIRGPDDLLEDLHLSASGSPSDRPDRPDGQDPAGAGASAEESAVWTALASAAAPERLATVTGLGVGEVMSALVGLELRGLVRSVGGRYERRTPRPAGM